MAALLIAGPAFAIGKIRERRAEKRAKRKHNADRYAELERETWSANARPNAERANGVEKAFAPPKESSSKRSSTDEKRRESFASDREAVEVIREVETRLRSASLNSPGKAPEKIKRKSTGEMLFGDRSEKSSGG